MSWFLLNRNLTLLEPYDWKLSCTVLRGERGSNAPDLPGKALSSANMAEYLRYMYKTVRKYYGEAGGGRHHFLARRQGEHHQQLRLQDTP